MHGTMNIKLPTPRLITQLHIPLTYFSFNFWSSVNKVIYINIMILATKTLKSPKSIKHIWTVCKVTRDVAGWYRLVQWGEQQKSQQHCLSWCIFMFTKNMNMHFQNQSHNSPEGYCKAFCWVIQNFVTRFKYLHHFQVYQLSGPGSSLILYVGVVALIFCGMQHPLNCVQTVIL